jgi:hypothetical protein
MYVYLTDNSGYTTQKFKATACDDTEFGFTSDVPADIQLNIYDGVNVQSSSRYVIAMSVEHEQARLSIFRYIETYYNEKRRHYSPSIQSAPSRGACPCIWHVYRLGGGLKAGQGLLIFNTFRLYIMRCIIQRRSQLEARSAFEILYIQVYTVCIVKHSTLSN